MRTTLTLNDEVLEAARELAAMRRQPLGQVVSDLARQGLRTRSSYPADDDGFPVFQVSEDSPPITLADVKGDEDTPY